MASRIPITSSAFSSLMTLMRAASRVESGSARTTEGLGLADEQDPDLDPTIGCT